MTAVATMFDPAIARRQMVDSQLRPNRVLDSRIIAAMGEVPRELFVPERLAEVAYVDEDIEVAHGRYLMEPMVLGRLLQSLDLQASHRVLEIGSGCGYATAVLARIVSQVVALEVDAELATRASRLLARLEVNNAQVTVGSLAAGEPSRAPYERILFSGAAEEIPDALKRQLAEGGRLAAVVRSSGVGKAVVVERHGEAFGVREVFDAAIPILPGLTRPKGFVF